MIVWEKINMSIGDSSSSVEGNKVYIVINKKC